MRRLFLVAAVVFMSLGVACANADRPIAVENLPQKAQQFIKKYFANVGVTYVTEDRDVISKDYEVMFADGSKVDFAANGEWTSVECKGKAVPAGIVPQQIEAYVKQNYPDAHIRKIDRDRTDYEVSLSNRLELTFNKNFKLIEIDD
ncbi:MAG: PepSY-like domain-containing protein [Alistipes sp.]|nr:PepSY-like domain-containing protein [Alistipes sp.]